MAFSLVIEPNELLNAKSPGRSFDVEAMSAPVIQPAGSAKTARQQF